MCRALEQKQESNYYTLISEMTCRHFMLFLVRPIIDIETSITHNMMEEISLCHVIEIFVMRACIASANETKVVHLLLLGPTVLNIHICCLALKCDRKASMRRGITCI